MTHRTQRIGRLFVVSWEGELTVRDQSEAVQALVDSCDAEGEAAKPVLLVILGADLQPPGADVRREGMGHLRTALKRVVALEIVVGGKGLLATLQRTTARGLALLSPELRGRLYVHDGIASAVAHASTLVPLDTGALVRRLSRESYTTY